MESFSDIKAIRALACDKWHFPHERQDYFERVKELAFPFAKAKVSKLWLNTPIARDEEIAKLDRLLVEERNFLFEERNDCIKRFVETFQDELSALKERYFWEEPVNSHDILFDIRLLSLRIDWCRFVLAFIRMEGFIYDCSPNVEEMVCYNKWGLSHIFTDELRLVG